MKIILKNIVKKFKNTTVLKNINLTIDSNSFTSLLGPSGCGKTTLLRIIAGLETPDSGEIYFDNECIFSKEKGMNTPPEKRNLGFVFQDFALWPHMTVFENTAFGLRAQKRTENLEEKVTAALKAVKLENFKERYPHELSGGQQQRVAFARAIVTEPQCILFDEPLSALDAILRDEMRIEIKNLMNERNITSVFVTHDQLEAMSMSDSIVVMNGGIIHQKGTPEEIYSEPADIFVAKFVGHSNWLDEKTMVRPENILIKNDTNKDYMKMKVKNIQFLGTGYELNLIKDSMNWRVSSPKKYKVNDEVSIFIAKENIIKFKGEI